MLFFLSQKLIFWLRNSPYTTIYGYTAILIKIFKVMLKNNDIFSKFKNQFLTKKFAVYNGYMAILIKIFKLS